MDAILAKGLTKEYGDFKALDRVSFNVRLGDFFGVFGPNGAGKSTLLKILTGQIEQTEGETYVLGFDVRERALEVKKRVGIVPESEAPPSFLTTREFLGFVCDIRQVNEPEKKIDRWIDYFDLKGKEDVICKDLSKGTRQKVMLSSAFIHEPKLLFMDEPFINLDPIYQRRLRDFLLDYARQGNTIFMCTHILEIADKLCNNILFLDQGRIIEKGSKNDLVKKHGSTLEGMFHKLVGGGPPYDRSHDKERPGT